MKLDRLIGILAILLQRERVTAPYLAEKFEVSRRTVNRDIETLCMAGIPVATAQGANGGIYISDEYKIDKTLLTNEELNDILVGLNSLDGVGNIENYETLKSKLNLSECAESHRERYVDIDLASWYRPSLAPKIKLLRKAIKLGRTVNFEYYSQSGEGVREIEPYSLIYRWSSWYVWGRCRKKEDWRMFKLNRMQCLAITDTTYTRINAKPPIIEDYAYPDQIKAKIAVDASYKWRLIDEFGPDSFTVGADGRLILTFGFKEKDYLFSWIMGFCGNAELIEPIELRTELIGIADKISTIHS